MVTQRVIDTIYLKCLAKENEKMQPCINVNGLTQGKHVFNKERLQKEFNKVLCAVTKLPASLRYSSNPKGKAWIMARTGNGSLSGMSLQTTERLIAMAIALGIMRVVPHEEIPCDIAFVVIDDIRLHRQEMLLPRQQRNWMLVKWPVFSV